MTLVMKRISKSKFKPNALDYFRQVEKTGTELIITDRGRPVVKIVPYSPDPDETLKELRSPVLRYDRPTEPVAFEDWESLK